MQIQKINNQGTNQPTASTSTQSFKSKIVVNRGGIEKALDVSNNDTHIKDLLEKITSSSKRFFSTLLNSQERNSLIEAFKKTAGEHFAIPVNSETPKKLTFDELNQRYLLKDVFPAKNGTIISLEL